MTERVPSLRPAEPRDAPAIARIMQDWLDATLWIPNLHSLDETTKYCRHTLIGRYATTVAGDPPVGFLSVEPDNSIAALYVAPTGQGTGAALLEDAQVKYDTLALWVFEANEGAQRFYERHGFSEVGRTSGDNDEGLPDIRMTWSA